MLLHNLPLISAKEVFGRIFVFGIAEVYAPSLVSWTLNFLTCVLFVYKNSMNLSQD